MSVHQAIKLLVQIRNKDSKECSVLNHISANTNAACDVLSITPCEIENFPIVVELSGEFYPLIERNSGIWKFLCLSFHILIDRIKQQSDVDDLENLLSVAQQKDIKNLLEIVLMLGLVPNLIPGVGVPISARSQFADKIPLEDISMIEKYIRVRFCSEALLRCYNNPDLRKLIVSRHLGDLLAALFQLSVAPFKKPSSTDFPITVDVWIKLQKDRLYFKEALKHIIQSTYQPAIIKEIMILMGMRRPLAPKWLKIEATKILCNILIEKDGLISLTRAMFDSESVDTGTEWKQLEVVQQLIFDISNDTPNFYKNFSQQILTMLDQIEENPSQNLYLILPRLFLKALFDRRRDIFEKDVLEVIFQRDAIDARTLKYLYFIYGLEINTKTDLPLSEYIFPYVDLIVEKVELTNYIKPILLKLFTSINNKQLSDAVRLLLYRIDVPEIRKSTSFGVDPQFFEDLINDLPIVVQANIFRIVFNEFTNNFTQKEMRNIDLLQVEDDLESVLKKFTNAKLISLNILAKLSEKKEIIKRLDVNVMVKFIIKLFKKYQKTEENFDNSQALFLGLMLLEILVNSVSVDHFKSVVNPLESVAETTKNDELRTFIRRMNTRIRNPEDDTSTSREITPFEKALEEIQDPLLPVRAHGIMCLKNLIEKRDSETLGRKQYVLCILQEKLKDPDSYIYLAAINAIAALGVVETDGVIEVLTEEYVNVREWRDEVEHQRVRLSLGEILVKVTKHLGETAPKYKPLLLNALLFGIKDYDNLIRASSLSNLGEVCEVLGYKLGNAVTEILLALDAIIETDKFVEVRRAAVMVIHHLLKGLGCDALVFLKEHLLPIYRKLKEIYRTESDDVMKLHAQLALEELDTATRKFLLPPNLSAEKRIDILS